MPAALAVSVLVAAAGCGDNGDPPGPPGDAAVVDGGVVDAVDAPVDAVDARIDAPDGPPPFD